MYLIAILLPPLAVLICGKPFQAFINLLLCCLLIIPGIVHAIFVVHEYKADQRAAKINPSILTEPEKKKSSIAALIVLGAIIVLVIFFIIMEFVY